MTSVRIGMLALTLVASGDFGFSQSTEELYELARLDRRAFAEQLSAGATNDFEKVRQIVMWLGTNFEWTSTDYQRRTVGQIIERKGGNCAELAQVAEALFEDLDIRRRRIREINLHVENDRRQSTAEKMVREKGERLSVFGGHHNDHVWLEVYDQESDHWVPVDPSLGIAGLEAWLKARAWFGDRTTLDPTSDEMLFPMAIFALNEKKNLVENRTRYYMVEELDALYGRALSPLASWDSWVEALEVIDDLCLGAFQGRVNLHDYGDDIVELGRIYEQLRQEYRESQRSDG